MKVAIMQPYFFPYLGYFQLINAVDKFILGDEVQYIYQGWINRNRILKPVEPGYCYIMVPLVKHSHKAPIKAISVLEGAAWKEKVIRQLDHYKRKAPYYKNVVNMLQEAFQSKEKQLSKLNAHYLKCTCQYIGLEDKIELQSETLFDYTEVTTREDRPIKMCQQMGATEFINPCGGIGLYSTSTFAAANIKLSFLYPELKPYCQQRETFEEGLSIIDVMMFNSASDIKLMLKDCTIQ